MQNILDYVKNEKKDVKEYIIEYTEMFSTIKETKQETGNPLR